MREKLIDDVHSELMGLLQRTPYIRCEDVNRQYAVNWLMNNGVTVQKWIPVTERLPDLELVEVKAEDMDLYSCLVSKNTQKLRKRKLVTRAWYDGIGFMDMYCIDITTEVTHWMPLPEPPKENE